MQELQIFKDERFGEIRTTTKDGEPLFVAADVCRSLEIGNPSQALIRLDEDEKFTTLISNEGAATGKSQLSFVTESGLYSLVLGSRKPEAKAFKRWITHDVIPTIRKHGAYMTPETIESVLLNPDTIIKLATELKAEREKATRLTAKITADAPKVLFADAVSTAKTSILVGELAKLLKQNGVDIGQNRLFEWLRGNGYLIKRAGSDYNMPTQKSMDMGLFEIKETVIAHADGHTSVNKTPKLTGKGQEYFVYRFLGIWKEPVDEIARYAL